MARTQHQESVLARLLPLLSALLPGIVSILLLAQLNERYSHSFTNFATNQRAIVQIVVQILSHVLGLLQIYSVRSYYIFAIRSQAFKRSTRLGDVGFWIALRNGQVGFSLSTKYLLLTAIVVMICVIPSALWAGALTPLLLTEQLPANMTLDLPFFSQSSSKIWNSEFEMRGYELWNIYESCQSSGLITTCPVPVLQGNLLSTASSATAANGSVRKHSKIDSADWSYVGRSYGVGASLGLVTLDTPKGAETISYTDYGYISTVKCTFNSSADYMIEYLGTPNSPNQVSLYAVQGVLPNSFDAGVGTGVGESYTLVSTWSNTRNILAWSARSIGGRNYISITTGSEDYSEFNQTQCNVEFAASAFGVVANLTSKQIKVDPNMTAISDGRVVNATITFNAMNSLNLLSRMSSSLYTSILGDALRRNLMSVAGVNSSTTTAIVPSSSVLMSVQDSFTAMLDDILGAYGAAQISLANDTASTFATVIGPASRIGAEIYIIAIMAVSMLVCISSIVELLRTRFWSGLPAFDILDARSVMVAASVGGKSLAEMISSGKEDGCWMGKPDDAAISRLDVQFCTPGVFNDMPAVVPIKVYVENKDWILEESRANQLESKDSHGGMKVSESENLLVTQAHRDYN